MSNATAPKQSANRWASWGTIAVVAILAGVLLPQLMPGEMALEKAAPKAEAKDKANLEYAAPVIPEAPNVQSMFMRLGIGTALVLGLCVASIWGMKRWMDPQASTGNANREMKLAETLALGNRCNLHLVKLGNQQILIGVDAAGIKTIVPLTSPFEEVMVDTGAEPMMAETIAFPKKTA